MIYEGLEEIAQEVFMGVDAEALRREALECCERIYEATGDVMVGRGGALVLKSIITDANRLCELTKDHIGDMDEDVLAPHLAAMPLLAAHFAGQMAKRPTEAQAAGLVAAFAIRAPLATVKAAIERFCDLVADLKCRHRNEPGIDLEVRP